MRHDPYKQYSGPPAPQIQPMAVPGEGRTPSVPQIQPMAGPAPVTPAPVYNKLNPKQFIQQQGGFQNLAARAVGAHQTAHVFAGKGGIGRALRYTLTGSILSGRAHELYSQEATQKISQMGTGRINTGGIDTE